MPFEQLLVYISANINDEVISFNQINNYKYQSKEFFYEIDNLKMISELENSLELYCILANKSIIQSINKEVREKIREIFNDINEDNIDDILKSIRENANNVNSNIQERFINLYIKNIISEDKLKYPISFEIDGENGVSCLICYFTESPEENKQLEVNKTIELFLEKEKPFFMGKQIMIQSFLLQDIRDRKILNFLPSNIEGVGWYALLEGGIKLYLNNDIPYLREKINSSDIGMCNILEVNSMLHNPCYSYKKFFTPYELFEEWNDVLLYALAVLPIEYNEKTLGLLYEDFLKHIEDKICDVEEVEQAIIKKEIYIQALIVNINNIRKYLEGKEEIGISKNMLIILKNRYIYLPIIYEIIRKYYSKEVLEKNSCISFSNNKWKEMLEKVDQGSTYEKGICLEQIADYFISCIQGVKVTKKRARTRNEEMDLIYCNVSETKELWDLGALILVECKNWKKKVDAKVIRSLSYIMEKKGINTLLLFTKQGITKGVEEEIKKQACHNKFIITFCIEELYDLDEYKLTPKDLLLDKYNKLMKITENNMELIM